MRFAKNMTEIRVNSLKNSVFLQEFAYFDRVPKLTCPVDKPVDSVNNLLYMTIIMSLWKPNE